METHNQTENHVKSGELPQTSSTPTSERGNGKKAIIALLIVVVLAGLAYYAFKMAKPATNDDVAALVNGTAISKSEYNESLAMVTQNATSMGVDMTDSAIQEDIKKQALDILINNTLLIDGAKKSGITASNDEVQSEYDKLVTELGGDEALKAKMQEVGLTEEKLRSNISDRILVDAYLQKETDIENVSVSDEEVNDFYSSIAQNSTTTPPLSDIKDQITAQLEGQKRQVIVNDFLTTLRNNAQIEIKV